MDDMKKNDGYDPEIEETMQDSGAASLAARSAAVMGSVGWIEKRGKHPVQGWTYPLEADIKDSVRKAMVEAGLSLSVSVVGHRADVYADPERAKKGWTRTTVDMVMTTTCAQTGASHTTSWVGVADDNSDKGVPKAVTAGLKTWMIAQYLIPSGEEPDGCDSPPDSGGAGRVMLSPAEIDAERQQLILNKAKDAWKSIGGNRETWERLPEKGTAQIVADAIKAGCRTTQEAFAWIFDGVEPGDPEPDLQFGGDR